MPQHPTLQDLEKDLEQTGGDLLLRLSKDEQVAFCVHVERKRARQSAMKSWLAWAGIAAVAISPWVIPRLAATDGSAAFFGTPRGMALQLGLAALFAVFKLTMVRPYKALSPEQIKANFDAHDAKSQLQSGRASSTSPRPWLLGAVRRHRRPLH